MDKQPNDVYEYIRALQSSASYKLGFYITLPVRWFLEVVIRKNKDFKSFPELVEAPKFIPEAATQEVNQMAPVNSKGAPITKQVVYRVENITSLDDKILKDKEILGRVSFAPSVLFISPHLPDYDTSSGGKRATRMLELLSDKFDVHVYTLGDKQDKYAAKLKELGCNVLQAPDLKDINVNTHDYTEIKNQVQNIDVIIFAWYTTWYQSALVKKLYPNAKIIFDSVDIHWLREFRLIGEIEDLTYERVMENKLNEIRAYEQGDFVWVVTKEDGVELKNEIPFAQVKVVSNIHEIEHPGWNKCNRNTILFLGGYKHVPNLAAVSRLAEDIFPIIKKQIPDAELIIAGSHAPTEVVDLGKLDGVTFKGFIEEDELENLYENSFCTVVPLNAGAGIKGKICEAIANGIVVISNAIGNEGINLVDEDSGFIGETDEELAASCIKALNRNYDVDKLVTKAQNKLSALVGPSTVLKSMVDSIIPQISICVVTWNRLELVKRCIESVLLNTRYPNYKLIVWSNGCADGTQEYLAELAKTENRLHPVLSKTNDVFVIPNNKMMELYPDNDAVLLNNDTYVTNNWLLELHRTAYRRKDIGISGSKIIYPDGRLQEFGSELFNNYSGNNIGKFKNPNDQEYQSERRVGYVSGCSMYIKRKTMERIGVFDEAFHPCYCEDSDYCYTAWEHGIETVVTPNSVIYHDEGGTSGTSTSSGFKAYQEINFLKFNLKHRGKLNGIEWYLQRDLKVIEKSALSGYKDEYGQLILNGTQPGDKLYDNVEWLAIGSKKEFWDYFAKNVDIFRKRRMVEEVLLKSSAKDFSLSGMCPIDKTQTKFNIDLQQTDLHKNFIGDSNKLNAQDRAICYRFLDANPNGKTLLFGNETKSLYDYLNKQSELLKFDLDNSSLSEKMDQSATDSYQNILHISALQYSEKYYADLELAYNQLQSKGKFILSTRVNLNEEKNIIRAQKEKMGYVKNILDEKYEMIDGKKQIIFQEFGWELLDNLKTIGFKDVNIINIWSLNFGLMGDNLMFIEATK